MSAAELQFVTFGLGDEVFAVPVGVVREILDYARPFKIPNGPDYLLGLLDVRGQGVPTLDLRLKLGLPEIPASQQTRILVLDIPAAERHLTLGLVTDRVFEVASFRNDQIEAAPEIGIRWNSDYISGVVRREQGFVVIIDLTLLLSQDIGTGALQRKSA
jgi:purine-binding chemotaxis protein CheW